MHSACKELEAKYVVRAQLCFFGFQFQEDIDLQLIQTPGVYVYLDKHSPMCVNKYLLIFTYKRAHDDTHLLCVYTM